MIKNLYLLNLNFIWEFILSNLFIIILCFLTYIGICLDERFKFKNKIFIGLSLFFFFFFLLFFNVNDISIWLQELFWYTIILNVSFLFHVCYLNWLYIYCWNRRYQYLCFLINRISFLFSLTFVIYLLNHICYYFYVKLKKISKIFKKFYILILFILKIIRSILLFFVITFANYSLLLQGNLEKIFTLKNFLVYFFIFIVTIIASIFIFGIPRLYLIWIYLFLYNTYEVFMEYWENENKEKIFTFIEIIKFSFKDKNFYEKIFNYINIKQRNVINEVYNKPYLDSYKFLSTRYSGTFEHFIHYLLNLSEEIFFFKTIFKFKDWYTDVYDYWDQNAWTWDLEFTLDVMFQEFEDVQKVYNLSGEEIKKLKNTFGLDDPEKFKKLDLMYWKKRQDESKFK